MLHFECNNGEFGYCPFHSSSFSSDLFHFPTLFKFYDLTTDMTLIYDSHDKQWIFSGFLAGREYFKVRKSETESFSYVF